MIKCYIKKICKKAEYPASLNNVIVMKNKRVILRTMICKKFNRLQAILNSADLLKERVNVHRVYRNKVVTLSVDMMMDADEISKAVE